MKRLSLVLLILGLLITSGHIFSASAPGSGQRFLDLPEGFSITEGEEKDEGGAWFFCLDKSDSMSSMAACGQPKFLVRNRETIRVLAGLTDRCTATIIFFDHKKMKSDLYGDPPLTMNAANKARMIGQVSRTTVANHTGSDSCIASGMVRLLQVANQTFTNRTMIVVADGRTQCCGEETDPDRVFRKIMAHNVHRIPINTTYTGLQTGSDWELGKPLLECLARETYGTFTIAQ